MTKEELIAQLEQLPAGTRVVTDGRGAELVDLEVVRLVPLLLDPAGAHEPVQDPSDPLPDTVAVYVGDGRDIDL